MTKPRKPRTTPGKSSYGELLRDPRWQRRRLEILSRDGWECTRCGETEKTLEVHHRYYLGGKAPWEYEAQSLATLCSKCHEDAESGRKELIRATGDLSHSGRVIGYVRAVAAIEFGPVGRISAGDYSEAEGISDAFRLATDLVVTMAIAELPNGILVSDLMAAAGMA